MSTLLWKELRENFQWALLAMLALGGAELYTLFYFDENWHLDSQFYRGMTVCRDSFLTITTFGSAAIGFILGMLQILPELKRDRWAALLHRPVSRDVILAGKVLTGVLLYAMATGVPLLTCIWLAATPGHFRTPFVPGLTLAPIADTCVGLVYYFAALLMALQRGRWLGLRGLPLLAAVQISFFTMGTESFGNAVAAAALLVLALYFAARGAMQNRDSFTARSWLAKAALLAVAFYGICGLADIARFVAFNDNDADDAITGRYELTDEGRIVKLNLARSVVTSVQDLNGHTLDGVNYRADRIREHVYYVNHCSLFIGDPHGLDAPAPNAGGYRLPITWIRAANAYYFPQTEQWFHLVKEGSLVGMSPGKKKVTARLDRGDFQPADASPVPFPPGTTVQHLASEGCVLRLNDRLRFVKFSRRQVTDVTLPRPEPIYGVCPVWPGRQPTTSKPIAVALASAAVIYNEQDASILVTLPYHQDVGRWGSIRAGFNPALQRYYLRYAPSEWVPKESAAQMPDYFEEFNLQGELLHTDTLPPIAQAPPHPGWIRYVAAGLQTPVFFFGGQIYDRVQPLLKNSPAAKPTAEELAWTRIATPEVPILSLLCAITVFLWARRAHFSSRRAWMWTVFALAFNIAGLLIFRLVADWPRLVPCTACGQRRPIDQEYCPNCADGWPAPQLNGTEIVDAPIPGTESAATA